VLLPKLAALYCIF